MHNAKDDHITRHVNNKLASRGFGSQHLTVQTSNGLVTLSGAVQFAHQKKAALKSIAGMAGIRRVIDQLTVRPAVKRT
ncbi:MAG: BON domain-containing protein [Pirellulales bacterium]